MLQCSDVGLVDAENVLKSHGRLRNGVIYASNFQESKLYNTIQNEIKDDPLKAYLRVHSDNFKNWFGDWENSPSSASKVVDENGEPLVVYHGTGNYGFSDFDKSKCGTHTNSISSKSGIFFSPNVIVSWAYSNGHAADVEFYDEGGEVIGKQAVLNFPYGEYKELKGRIVPRKNVNREKKLFGLYNKKIMVNNDEFNVLCKATYGLGEVRDLIANGDVVSGKVVPRNDDESMYKTFLNIRNMPHLDYSDDYVPRCENGFIDMDGWSKVWEKFDYDMNNLPKEANGLVVDGLFDRGGFCIKNGMVERQYIVFEPNQIKSINNNGEFSQGVNIYR